MRQYISGRLTVTYPEQVVWLQDSNVVNIESSSSSDKVGADITVRHPGGTETRTIRHISELSRLLFVLDDALLALHDDNIGQYSCQVDLYNNGASAGTLTFAFQLLDGKSFTNRSHAISRTMYFYNPDELAKVQIYSPGSGELAIGGQTMELRVGLNQYNLSTIIAGNGTYTACLYSAGQAPVAQMTGDVPLTPNSSNLYWSYSPGSGYSRIDGGDVWRELEIIPFCHTIIVDDSCTGNDFVELRYKDCDGCFRYLGGKLTKEANKASMNAYERTSPDNAFRNIPRRKITGTSRSITVGFNDIATDAYPQDIRYSDEVWMRMYNGEWWPVVLATESIAVKGDQDTQDFEVEIIISEE